ncbi:vanadium-dependent haloperoxidase [Streptomyces sp. NPDC006307]|uniref:vanadium-dependent haloperoxidase n=1 Tax=Streptomyces sp. NPDC006307 TaxID=3156748 RepID=UPI0033B80A10
MRPPSGWCERPDGRSALAERLHLSPGCQEFLAAHASSRGQKEWTMCTGKAVSRRRAVIVATLLLMGGLTGQPAGAEAAPPQPETASSVITTWARRVSETVSPDGRASDTPVWRTYVSLAMYNAVVGIEGRYAPYRWRARAPHGASAEAAAATAAYEVLRTGFPQSGPALRTAWKASLARVPDGPAEQAGVAFGKRAAQHIMALRTEDGRGAFVPFPPSTAPGLWRPTPPDHEGFTTAWIGRLRPFLLDKPSRFRPGPPPEPASAPYARDLAEVQAYGGKVGSRRSARQTETALFADRMDIQQALADHATRHAFDLAETARLYAAANTVMMDARIAAWDAKLHYASWRPITAIREAHTDGNPATRPDPAWEPLLPTPAHPDYLSGHATWAGALMRTLEVLFDSSRVDLNIKSVTTGTTRHYENSADFVRDVVDARVWSGIHTRTADVVGSTTGKRVAEWALRWNFLDTHK